ncbi:glycoside hydrolase family 16 protein [Mucilaginibacter sp.]|uniref:glycoside hydrolase family 16 protein n=1 Tax=Mucilaginibacter sp. TaxID=1882438 RepID=UPI002841753E|nr:glycoside hydrolase family 16 protein [Mucilaginibacter sp.]MDR3696092.1 glycoside hydrolase family 16 protein [Mucilaginibacter sp.]
MKKKYYIIYALMSIGMLSCSKKQAVLAPFVSITQPAKVYTFDTTPSWSDEFGTDGAPDPTLWTYDTGGGGWGNNELEYYTNTTNNASISNGILSITARKESIGGMNYSSARMISKTPETLLYGRIEVKAKLPSGRGTWPAIWMLPNDYAYGNWPASGEIDIMEMVGYDPNNVHFSIHDQTNFGGNSKTSTYNISTASTDYHLYRVDWTPDAVTGYYDNVQVFTFQNDKQGNFATWPFDKPFHVMLNLAIGGNWGGVQGVDDTIFPTAMQIDYVRYYKMITSN